MTPTRAAIEERLRKATPGPWVAEPDDFSDFTIRPRDAALAVAAVVNGEFNRMGGRQEEHQANADLIAHAPTDIAFLLSEIDRLGKELEWQDISAAPKDGTKILAWHSGLFLGALVLYFSDGMWREPKDGAGLKTDPDFWRPLPAPPATQPADEQNTRESDLARLARPPAPNGDVTNVGVQPVARHSQSVEYEHYGSSVTGSGPYPRPATQLSATEDGEGK